MDRSFLSDPAVVARSRDFVCIRLATYESASEAAVLQSVFQSRSGQLENTVFAILTPDGKTPLVRSGRSPREGLGGPEEGTRKLADLAAKFPGSAPVGGALPLLADLRRGLNVASCEIQPLVVIVARSAESRQKIEETLLPLAWSKEFVGRYDFVRAKDAAEAAASIEGKVEEDGIYIVQPDAFGQKGTLLAAASGSGRDTLQKALALGLTRFTPQAKDSRRHIDEGVRRGLNWKTEIPVTDPMSPRR
jgi:hypothetical protein